MGGPNPIRRPSSTEFSKKNGTFGVHFITSLERKEKEKKPSTKKSPSIRYKGGILALREMGDGQRLRVVEKVKKHGRGHLS